MTYKFYDTCSLLLRTGDLFENEDERIILSTVTLKELENIKTAYNKDPETKYAARQLTKILDENPNKYETWIFQDEFLEPIAAAGLEINPDTKILACALDAKKNLGDVVFYTNDLALKAIARSMDIAVDSVEIEPEAYDGYKVVTMDNDAMATFYTTLNDNHYNLLTNEYLVIKSEFDEVVDTLRWTGTEYKHLSYSDFNSKWFGKVKPWRGDIYQAMYADSLSNNTITMIKGPAGSGKTYLALSYLFSRMEKGDIDKIIIFCNTVATKNSAKLGYYPGTRDEKLLDSQIGNLLSSKLGDKFAVQTLIEQGTLVLLPLADIRGYDTSGMHAGVYISEAQNMDVESMKLVLQRIGEDSICIIDGDFKAQVDLVEYAGANNGMRRASKVFRGHDIYGEITLQNIYRSKIAGIAEKM